MVERRVVGNHDGAAAAAMLYRLANFAKELLEHFRFGPRLARRVVRIDADEAQRRRIHVGAGQRRYLVMQQLGARQAFAVVVQQNRGKFQNRVAAGVEAAGFQIDDNRQKTAKAVCNLGSFGHCSLHMSGYLTTPVRSPGRAAR